jgi:hypothetical protein
MVEAPSVEVNLINRPCLLYTIITPSRSSDLMFNGRAQVPESTLERHHRLLRAAADAH